VARFCAARLRVRQLRVAASAWPTLLVNSESRAARQSFRECRSLPKPKRIGSELRKFFAEYRSRARDTA
jgi:hypothetical protein